MNDDFHAILEDHWAFLADLHARGSLAPVAVCMHADGSIVGNAFTMQPGAESPTFGYVMSHFASEFRDGFREGKFRAVAAFFHGCVQGSSVREARRIEEASALVCWMEHQLGEAIEAVIPYEWEVDPANHQQGGWKYRAMVVRPKASAATAPTIRDDGD